MTESRRSIWTKLLEGFDDDTILLAALQIIAQGREWPPNVGDLRTMCVRISHGELEDPSPTESWGRIMCRACGGKEPLLEIDRRVMERVGLTVTSVGMSQNISADRAHYFRAFDEYIRTRNIQRNTPAATMKAIGMSRSDDMRQLPSPRNDAKQDGPHEQVSAEHIQQMIDGLKRQMRSERQ